MKEQIINNAQIILIDEVIKGSILIKDGIIKRIDASNSQLPQAIDWENDYLLPGLIELHTDNMEKYFMPRPGVLWPKISAIMAHDMQMASSGITTVLTPFQLDMIYIKVIVQKSSKTSSTLLAILQITIYPKQITSCIYAANLAVILLPENLICMLKTRD